MRWSGESGGGRPSPPERRRGDGGACRPGRCRAVFSTVAAAINTASTLHVGRPAQPRSTGSQPPVSGPSTDQWRLVRLDRRSNRPAWPVMPASNRLGSRIMDRRKPVNSLPAGRADRRNHGRHRSRWGRGTWDTRNTTALDLTESVGSAPVRSASVTVARVRFVWLRPDRSSAATARHRSSLHAKVLCSNPATGLRGASEQARRPKYQV